jgi:hypothetical protein
MSRSGQFDVQPSSLLVYVPCGIPRCGVAVIPGGRITVRMHAGLIVRVNREVRDLAHPAIRKVAR